MSGRIQDGAKLVASVERQKLYTAKITWYPVFSITRNCLNSFRWKLIHWVQCHRWYWEDDLTLYWSIALIWLIKGSNSKSFTDKSCPLHNIQTVWQSTDLYRDFTEFECWEQQRVFLLLLQHIAWFLGCYFILLFPVQWANSEKADMDSWFIY